MSFGKIKIDASDADELFDEFKKLDEFTDPKRFVVYVWGAEKEGKSHFVATAAELVAENPNLSEKLREYIRDGTILPGAPLWVIDTEGKFKKFVVKFRKRDIHVLEVWTPKRDGSGIDAEKTIVKIKKALMYISGRSEGGTIAIDSWTDPNAWMRKYIQKELVKRKAEGHELGDLIPLKPSDYEVRNDEMSYIMYWIQNYCPNHHVILSVRGENKWEKNPNGKGLVKTGNLQKKMYKQTGFFADMEVFLEKIPLEDGGWVRTGRLQSTEFDEDDPVNLEWDNPTFPKLIDDIKDLAIKKRKVIKKVKQKPKVTKAGKKRVKKTQKRAK